MTATLTELADAIERAAGPDRELDRIVAEAIGMCTHRRQTKNGCQSDWGYDCDDCGADSWGNRSKDGFSRRLNEPWPHYTASLDAAMSLVPENADAAGERFRLEAHNSPGVLAPHVRASAWVAGAHRVFAATPALALAAAALRAREAQP